MDRHRGIVFITGAAVAAALIIAGCYWEQPYGYRQGRRCVVKRVRCLPGYGCYYEWWCKPRPKCKGRGHGHGGQGHGHGGHGQGPDGAIPAADAGVGADGKAPGDAGAGADLGLGCNGLGKCAAGYECVSGVCQPCPGGDCPCRSDDVCGADERCNLATGDCERVACADLTAEADCLARSDCLAIYSGQDCTRPDGKACKAGDSDCTCKTFAFALCSESSSSDRAP